MVWLIAIGPKHGCQGGIGGPLVDELLEEAVFQCILGSQVASAWKMIYAPEIRSLYNFKCPAESG